MSTSSLPPTPDLLRVYNNVLGAHGIDFVMPDAMALAHRDALHVVSACASRHVHHVIWDKLDDLSFRLPEVLKERLAASNFLEVTSIGIPTEVEGNAQALVDAILENSHDRGFCVRYAAQEIKRFCEEVVEVISHGSYEHLRSADTNRTGPEGAGQPQGGTARGPGSGDV